MATNSSLPQDINGADRISAADRGQITLMPLPTSLSLAEGRLLIDGTFSVALTGYAEPRLERAAQRLIERLSAQTGAPLPAGIVADPAQATLVLECGGAADDVQAVVEDEAYTLVATPDRAQISAPKPYGVLHGIETFLQLVKPGEEGFVLPAIRIEDQPRFPWRGLMLDVCRHWIPLPVILRNLDAMAAVKLNVLHFHLTEDQGFRVESKRFPKLHQMGSDGQFFTQDEIHAIVAYARDRGIRVVPEFDLPGHTTAWLVGHPELASAPGPYEIARTPGIKDATLDPTRKEVYEFLDRFFDEMVSLFPDPYVHIGGDEVSGTHWDENTEIQAFIAAHKLQDNHGLQVYFNRRVQAILANKGKSIVGWDEILHPDLPKDVVVHSWRGQASLTEAARLGYHAILSHGFYLDYHQPAAFHYGFDPIPTAIEAIDYSQPWRAWRISVTAPMGQMEGFVTVAGQTDPFQGTIVLEDMNLSAALQEIQLDGSRLFFSFVSGFGTIAAAFTVDGLRLEGSFGFAGFNTPVEGERSAGSDMPGTTPPAINAAAGLTPEQEGLILGGEACMWAELVNPETIDSRVWPRMAAIAERLWSPAELTQDEDDMYRRLAVTGDWLAWTGIRHQANYGPMLRRMTTDAAEPLKRLADVVEPVKFYSRHSSREYTQFTPLNRLVDTVPSESTKGREFGKMVDHLLEDPNRETDYATLQAWLTLWRDNHAPLQRLCKGSFLLRPLEPLSAHLANVAALGLQALAALHSGATFSSDQRQEQLALLDRAGEPQDELLLAVVPAIRKLVDAAHG